MSDNNQIKKNLNDALALIHSAMNLIDPPTEIYTSKQIELAICEKYEITSDQLKGKNKKGKMELARPAFALMLYLHVTDNKTEISKCMNRKSHSGAIDYINRANGLMQTNKKFKAQIEEMRAILRTL